ncbi:succinate dehydrogenase, hydrophobic membrane anchor protein [Dokdonella fugitiva]|jgi:succinate dehydrogenase / fumarate reductase membrane anchor subunit|uniref:Succinate dehydrogenase hydrophobic membrane anchor subunit n=1 Tax=Dokdonella fugitiva TaxID=328517 RepID=A0A4R2HWJ7_9GAMM|nr:succinate dehydrogenase, hydrophobic membrane anchor protein [Dokdonella fugitiva]TCO34988.1 succinate dehydrogenase / fumarate reductase membrane anchor subunit [Dokdonella fugitiva]
MNARLRSPLKNALGLGSARAGSHHFVVQRLTAAALVLLGLWFVWIVLELLHLDYAGAHALVAQPCNAVLLLAFVTAVFWHAQLGLQVVIEDYVHTRGSQLLLQVAVKFLCFIGAAASVLAILKIALGR